MLVNTVLGLVIDIETRRPALGNGGGGVSGPGILPVALARGLRVSRGLPRRGIVGVGGVASGRGRGGDVDGGRQRARGRHGDLRRSARALARAARAREWMAPHGVATRRSDWSGPWLSRVRRATPRTTSRARAPVRGHRSESRAARPLGARRLRRGTRVLRARVLEATSGVVAAIKPQVAFFERFGSGGYRVLERLLAEARDGRRAGGRRREARRLRADQRRATQRRGCPTLAARVDALTVSPYLGVGALAPFFDAALASGRGVFVLAATSNDEGRACNGAHAPSTSASRTWSCAGGVDPTTRRRTRLDRRRARRDARRTRLRPGSAGRALPRAGGRRAGRRRRVTSRVSSPGCEDGTVLVNVSRDILRRGARTSRAARRGPALARRLVGGAALGSGRGPQAGPSR